MIYEDQSIKINYENFIGGEGLSPSSGEYIEKYLSS